MTYESKEIHLVRRPDGRPVPEDFALATRRLPEPAAGQLLVRNHYISVDPYMRGRMDDTPSYMPPFELGEAMTGGAVGVVEASGSSDTAEGTHVLHQQGWRDIALVDASQTQVVDPSQVPSLSCYLGVLGMTGLTAYTGLLDVAEFKAGDAVFVSGAAGAVGQMVGQIARLKGAGRVIGSAGSAAKTAFLTDRLGFDAAFDYHDGPVADQLRAAAPDGIDVYFDNVGADHLEAAIGALNRDGRIAVCGMIAHYNDTEPAPGPRNLPLFIGKRLTMRGFLVLDRFDRMKDFLGEAGPWLASGRIINEETIVDGVENAVEAFLGMLRGDNLGKMVVSVT